MVPHRIADLAQQHLAQARTRSGEAIEIVESGALEIGGRELTRGSQMAHALMVPESE